MLHVRDAHRTAVRKPEGNRLLGRHRRTWAYNIKMCPTDWIYLFQDKGKMTVSHEYGREPPDSVKYRNVFTLSRRYQFLGYG
jgi:hypothetical protein